jgi:serine/threonine-protein kinase
MSGQGSPLVIGRYNVYGKIASGGMASVHFGRLLAGAGFSRTVAIKRLHPHLAEDPAFLSSLLDEARMAARINHPNVVPTLDVVNSDGELLIVMDYVRGESLSRLLPTKRPTITEHASRSCTATCRPRTSWWG